MSEHKSDKWLYTFTVDKEVEIEKSEDQEINGEKVKVVKKVKEKQPVTFALKRPNRRLYERADMFFGVQLSEGIRAGLLTKALLLKRYRNDGGALSDADAQYFYELTSKLSKLEEEHQRLLINVEKLPDSEKRKKTDEVVEQKMEVLKSLQTLETVNQALFAHTAETKAQVQLNNWWIVFLSHWDKEGNDNFVELFPGETFEEKMNQWDVFDEERPPHIVEALARFSLLIGLWNAGAQNKEDFEQGEKDYGVIASDAVNAINNLEKKAATAEETKVEPTPIVNSTSTSEVSPASS